MTNTSGRPGTANTMTTNEIRRSQPQFLSGKASVADSPAGRGVRLPSIAILCNVSTLIPLGANRRVEVQSDDKDDAAASPAAGGASRPGEVVDRNQWVHDPGGRACFRCRMSMVKIEHDSAAYATDRPRFAVIGSSESNALDAQDRRWEPADAHGNGALDGVNGHDQAALDSGGARACDDDSRDHRHHRAGREYELGDTSILRLTGWLRDVDPPSVNLPLALPSSAAFGELPLILTGRSLLDGAARSCVSVGSVTTAGAALLGEFFARFQLDVSVCMITGNCWPGTAVGARAMLVLMLSLGAHRPGTWGRHGRGLYHLAHSSVRRPPPSTRLLAEL
jgi:hypothetical protein